MATFNGEKFLRQQINSILSQLTSEDELIISDDGSTDKTLEMINDFNDSRIIVLHNQFKHGVNANFQNALSCATGEYIFLADQDDVWVPGKVDACVNALQHTDCVVHDAVIVDSNLATISESFFQERKSGRGYLKNLYKNSYLGCCMAFRRELLQKVLPIPLSRHFYHDNWIGGIADIAFSIEFIPFKGIYYRRHENNTSFTAKKSRFSIIRKINNRVVQVILTIKRLMLIRNV